MSGCAIPRCRGDGRGRGPETRVRCIARCVREFSKKLLIANRGEIAVRIARAASELGIATAAVYSADDATSLHVRKADEAHALGRAGAAAYLDVERIVPIASAAGCDAIHPGYGFLSENANLARRAAEQGIIFVGPSPDALRLFGDKIAVRKLAYVLDRGRVALSGSSQDIRNDPRLLTYLAP